MKIELTDISGLPEGLKAAVETADDKHSLDLSKVMMAEDLTGLKTALQKERENASAYSKFGKPADIEAKLADLAKQAEKGGKTGEDAQAKIDQITAQYEEKLGGANERLTKMMQRTARSDLKAELAKAGFIPEAIEDIASASMGRIQFNDDGSPKVLTSDGKPMIGSGSDHGATLADLAKELAESKSYAVRDAGKGGGGKPPQDGDGKSSQKTTVTRKAWDEMSTLERSAHVKNGGTVIDG